MKIRPVLKDREYVPLSSTQLGTVGVTASGAHLMHINPSSKTNPYYLYLSTGLAHSFRVSGEQMVCLLDATLEVQSK